MVLLILTCRRLYIAVHLEFRIGGMVHTATVHPRKWIQGHVYQSSDLPPPPVTYQPPPQFNEPHLASKSPSVPDPLWFQGDDVMHMSLKTLREIFRNVDPAELPPDLAECLAGNTATIRAHNEAGRRWEQQVSTKGKTGMSTDICQTSCAAIPIAYQQTATVDSAQVVRCPVVSNQPRHDTSRPSPQASPTGAHTSHPTKATVHRTEPHTSRGKRNLDDLALQVCSPHFSINLGEDVHPWELRDLFPEISTPNYPIGLSETRESTENNKSPKKPSPSRRPRRTAVSRIGKKKTGDGTVDIDMQAFVDVPLQHAEGTEILTLIGAGHIPVPSHLVLPSQQQGHQVEVGQSSKGPQKKKKHSGPSSQPPAPMHNYSEPTGHLGQQGLEEVCNTGVMDIGPSDRALGLPVDMGDDQVDDPYIDRVDYSDDDPLF